MNQETTVRILKQKNWKQCQANDYIEEIFECRYQRLQLIKQLQLDNCNYMLFLCCFIILLELVAKSMGKTENGSCKIKHKMILINIKVN